MRGEVRVFQNYISIQGNRKVINCRYFQNLPLIVANFSGIAMMAGLESENIIVYLTPSPLSPPGDMCGTRGRC